MKLPDTVKLLEHTFNITRELPENLDNDIFGCCNARRQTIYIAPDPAEDVQAHTIMHELMHVIEAIYGLRLSEDDIDNLALGILSLLRNNPALIDTIINTTGVGDAEKVQA